MCRRRRRGRRPGAGPRSRGGREVLAVPDGQFGRIARGDGVYGVVTRDENLFVRLHILDDAGTALGAAIPISEPALAGGYAAAMWDPLHGRFVAAWSALIDDQDDSEEVFVATFCPSP